MLSVGEIRRCAPSHCSLPQRYGRDDPVPETIFLPSGPQPVCLEPGFRADPGPSIETRLWSNGIVIDFDVPLFADAQ